MKSAWKDLAGKKGGDRREMHGLSSLGSCPSETVKSNVSQSAIRNKQETKISSFAALLVLLACVKKDDVWQELSFEQGDSRLCGKSACCGSEPVVWPAQRVSKADILEDPSVVYDLGQICGLEDSQGPQTRSEPSGPEIYSAGRQVFGDLYKPDTQIQIRVLNEAVVVPHSATQFAASSVRDDQSFFGAIDKAIKDVGKPGGAPSTWGGQPPRTFPKENTELMSPEVYLKHESERGDNLFEIAPSAGEPDPAGTLDPESIFRTSTRRADKKADAQGEVTSLTWGARNPAGSKVVRSVPEPEAFTLKNPKAISDFLMKKASENLPKSVELKMNPPELGKVTVLLSTRGDDVVVKFITQSIQTQRALTEASSDLSRALSERGLTLSGFLVDHGGAGKEPDYSSQRFSGMWGTRSRAMSRVETMAGVPEDVVRWTTSLLDYKA